jgi:hypothetical protein
MTQREVIVTYGEGWTIGKELLLRALMKRRGLSITRYCACCRTAFEPKPDDDCYECLQCRDDPDQRSAYT